MTDATDLFTAGPPTVPKTRPPDRPTSGIKKRLASLVDTLIAAALGGGAIFEGVVTSMHRPPYRRLDCDGRALAYIRTRPYKNELRVDVTGMWLLAKRKSRLRVHAPGGMMALVAHDELEVAEIAAYLNETVARTRAAFAAKKRR